MNTIASIFEKCGYTVTPSQTAQSKTMVEFRYITNPDGTVRWFWSENSSSPLFLNFYNIDSIRSRMFAWILKSIFIIGLQRIFFKKGQYYITELSASPLFDIHADWAIFTGTVGPNRKAVITTASNDKNIFTKVALGENAESLLKNEVTALTWLEENAMQSFEYPSVVSSKADVLVQTDISSKGTRNSTLTALHFYALMELKELSVNTVRLGDLPAWGDMMNTLDQLSENKDERLPSGMVSKIRELASTMNPDLMIETAMSHGDFTPWNMYEKSYKLAIYDWEMSKMNMPIGYDAFHFIMQQRILIDRMPWKYLSKEISSTINSAKFTRYFYKQDGTQKTYFQLYLLLNTTYYLKLYSQQSTWHTQVHWLLNTWNDALTSLLSPIKKHRELLISDLFDFLNNHAYAALKFPNISPVHISENSDIDLCVTPKVSTELSEYLKNHPLVGHYKVLNKSFMTTLHLICEDGGLLSVDLIWKFKRKALVMLNASEVLDTAYRNDFGIAVPSNAFDARYIGLFYALNNAPVPEKYSGHAAYLDVDGYALDSMVHTHFTQPNTIKDGLVQWILHRPENKGVTSITNRIHYYFDTLKSMIFNKGMIITFSGVDGAGKSTVIENIKYMVEKQLRMKTVVLRHRPSLLPILSAWTKGKKAAELESASRLPRMGTNSNIFSSMFRFSYYYLDYLIGQFAVYIYYVLRGYVVLYDRYYFDFINDSKRSNLHIPTGIATFGYRFLIKPDLNFFLYANSDLIISRKQELDRKTIDELTHKYLTLFKDLNKKKKTSRYIPIENIALETTLNTIIRKMKYITV